MHCKKHLVTSLAANYCIHFNNLGIGIFMDKILIILKASALEHFPVFYLRIMNMPGLVLYFFGQIKVSNRKDAIFDIVVQRLF